MAYGGYAGNLYIKGELSSGYSNNRFIGTNSLVSGNIKVNNIESQTATINTINTSTYNIGTGIFQNINCGSGIFTNLVAGTGTFISLTSGTGSLINLSSSLIPDTNGTRNLGSSTKYIGNAYIQNAYITNQTLITNLDVVNPLITLAVNNITDTVNEGLILVTATGVFSGLIRDHTTKDYYLYQNVSTTPSVGDDTSLYPRANLFTNTLSSSTGIINNLITSTATIGTGSFISLQASSGVFTSNLISTNIQCGTGIFEKLNAGSGIITHITCSTGIFGRIILPGSTPISLFNDNTIWGSTFSPLVDNVATKFMTITAPIGLTNYTAMSNYRISATDGTDIQIRSGIITIAIASNSVTVADIGTTASLTAAASTIGTLSPPTFTTSVTGKVVSVFVNTNSSLTSPVMKIDLINFSQITDGDQYTLSFP